jgi:hypothetical protein
MKKIFILVLCFLMVCSNFNFSSATEEKQFIYGFCPSVTQINSEAVKSFNNRSSDALDKLADLHDGIMDCLQKNITEYTNASPEDEMLQIYGVHILYLLIALENTDYYGYIISSEKKNSILCYQIYQEMVQIAEGYEQISPQVKSKEKEKSDKIMNDLVDSIVSYIEKNPIDFNIKET